MIKKIYLVHHTHFDIGFTDLAEEVLSQQLFYLDQGIRYCEKDPEYHWTIESGYLVRQYLENRPEEMQKRLIRLLQNGQMEVGAFEMQTLTEPASFAELLANLKHPVELGAKYNYPVETVILDDIGGFAGELPRFMNEAGLRYFIAGVGVFQTELPWADLPHAFYMKSKSGGRILVWNLGNDRSEISCEAKYAAPVYGVGSIYLGYHGMPEFIGVRDMGINYLLHGEDAEKPFSTKECWQILEKRLEKENYPYEEILLQYGGDNRAPSPHIAELVRKMNASGDFPEIVLTTPRHFFHLLEEKYGSSIPEVEGVLTDPWNLRINAVPSSLKKYRAAQRKYDYQRVCGLKNDSLLENLMLMADHTLGINNWGWQKLEAAGTDSLRSSCFDRPRDSWACKYGYATTADRMSRNMDLSIGKNGRYTDQEAVIVRNRAEHPVSGNVVLKLSSYAPQLSSLKDEAGKEIPRQCIALNTYMLYVEDVPAWGSKRLIPEFALKYDIRPEVPETTIPAEIKTEYYTFHFEPDGTLCSIKGKNGREFCDPAARFMPGEVLCEIYHDSGVSSENCGLKPSVERTIVQMKEKTGKVVEDGDLFISVLQRGVIDDAVAEICFRLWKKLERIDISCRINKPESPLKCSFYVALPFAGMERRFCFDQNCGIASPSELLPGAMQDLFYCSRYFALEAKEYSAVLCCPDAPVAEFGGLHTAKWTKELPFVPENNHIYPLLFNSVCNTDAPAWFPVLDTFEYSLFLSEQPFTPALAHRDWESSMALFCSLGYDESSAPLKGVPDQIRVHTDENGVVYLENPVAEPCSFRLELRGRSLDVALQGFELKKIG